jgi:hypothetical protein
VGIYIKSIFDFLPIFRFTVYVSLTDISVRFKQQTRVKRDFLAAAC